MCGAWRDALDAAATHAFPVFSPRALGVSPRALADARLARAPAWLAGAAVEARFADVDFGAAGGLAAFLARAVRVRDLVFARCGGAGLGAALGAARPRALTLARTHLGAAAAAALAGAGAFARLAELTVDGGGEGGGGGGGASVGDGGGGGGASVGDRGGGGGGGASVGDGDADTDAFNDAALLAIARGAAGGLEALSLRGAAVTSAGVAAALALCPALRAISVEMCPRCASDASAAWVCTALERGETLKVLSAHGCAGGAALLSAFAAAAATGGLPALECLDLSFSPWFGDSAAAALGAALRNGVARRLRELRLRACALTGAGLSLLRLALGAPCWAALQRLELAGCGALDDASLAEALRRASGLRALDLSAVPALSERTLRALASAPRLSSLKLRFAVRVDGDAVRSWLAAAALARAPLAPAMLAPASLPPLPSLDASFDASFDADATWQDAVSDGDGDSGDDAGGGAGGGGARPLHGGDAARDRAVLAARGMPSLPLEALDLAGALEIDDAAVALLGAAAGASLRRVDLEGAGVGLGDGGVCTLMRGTRALEALSLARVPVTDAALAALARAPRARLVSLDLSGGIEFTARGLCAAFAPNALPRLRTLRLAGVCAVDDAVITAALAAAPALAALCVRGAGSFGAGVSRAGLDAIGRATLRGGARDAPLVRVSGAGLAGTCGATWGAWLRRWAARGDAGVVAAEVCRGRADAAAAAAELGVAVRAGAPRAEILAAVGAACGLGVS